MRAPLRLMHYTRYNLGNKTVAFVPHDFSPQNAVKIISQKENITGLIRRNVPGIPDCTLRRREDLPHDGITLVSLIAWSLMMVSDCQLDSVHDPLPAFSASLV